MPLHLIDGTYELFRAPFALPADARNHYPLIIPAVIASYAKPERRPQAIWTGKCSIRQ